MRGELLVRGLLRGVLALAVCAMILASPVSAAVPTNSGGETVITARVMPVRHIVVDDDDVIQRIISNTSENVTPIVYRGNFQGEQIPMTDEVRLNYDNAIAALDMRRPADYIRKSPLQLLLAHVQHVSVLHLKAISQVKLPRALP